MHEAAGSMRAGKDGVKLKVRVAPRGDQHPAGGANASGMAPSPSGDVPAPSPFGEAAAAGGGSAEGVLSDEEIAWRLHKELNAASLVLRGRSSRRPSEASLAPTGSGGAAPQPQQQHPKASAGSAPASSGEAPPQAPRARSSVVADVGAGSAAAGSAAPRRRPAAEPKEPTGAAAEEGGGVAQARRRPPPRARSAAAAPALAAATDAVPAEESATPRRSRASRGASAEPAASKHETRRSAKPEAEREARREAKPEAQREAKPEAAPAEQKPAAVQQEQPAEDAAAPAAEQHSSDGPRPATAPGRSRKAAPVRSSADDGGPGSSSAAAARDKRPPPPPPPRDEDRSHKRSARPARPLKLPKLPMVRQGRGRWYRARVLQDTGSKVLLEFTGFEHMLPALWLPRDTDRVWRGSYKGKDWRYLGDGAWEPKGRAAAAAAAAASGSRRRSSRTGADGDEDGSGADDSLSASGDELGPGVAAGDSDSAGAGGSGATSPRARGKRSAAEAFALGGEEERQHQEEGGQQACGEGSGGDEAQGGSASDGEPAAVGKRGPHAAPRARRRLDPIVREALAAADQGVAEGGSNAASTPVPGWPGRRSRSQPHAPPAGEPGSAPATGPLGITPSPDTPLTRTTGARKPATPAGAAPSSPRGDARAGTASIRGRGRRVAAAGDASDGDAPAAGRQRAVRCRPDGGSGGSGATAVSDGEAEPVAQRPRRAARPTFANAEFALGDGEGEDPEPPRGAALAAARHGGRLQYLDAALQYSEAAGLAALREAAVSESPHAQRAAADGSGGDLDGQLSPRSAAAAGPARRRRKPLVLSPAPTDVGRLDAVDSSEADAAATLSELPSSPRGPAGMPPPPPPPPQQPLQQLPLHQQAAAQLQPQRSAFEAASRLDPGAAQPIFKRRGSGLPANGSRGGRGSGRGRRSAPERSRSLESLAAAQRLYGRLLRALGKASPDAQQALHQGQGRSASGDGLADLGSSGSGGNGLRLFSSASAPLLAGWAGRSRWHPAAGPSHVPGILQVKPELFSTASGDSAPVPAPAPSAPLPLFC